WSNDNMTIEVPVITAIVLVMLVMALSTELIGVHTALGAFVAGMLVGQSPILTQHIEGELRGFIVAFFSPVFFAVAGLGMDLRTLFDSTLLLLTLAVIVVASVGKFLGALAGGRLGGLTRLPGCQRRRCGRRVARGNVCRPPAGRDYCHGDDARTRR